LFDAVTIPVRSAPVPAILYAAFDLVGGAAVPLKTLVVARFIDAAIGAVQGSTPLATAIGNLVLVIAFITFEWLKRALHNFVDLKLVLSLRERYRTALVEKQMRLAYRCFDDGPSCDLMQRIAAHAEGGALKTAYFHLIDLAAFSLKVAGLLLIVTSAVWW
jgi:ABC-type multidrug transport system fused ATPase/permease subunit